METSSLLRCFILTLALGSAGCGSEAACVAEGDTLVPGAGFACCPSLSPIGCSTEGPSEPDAGVGACGTPLPACNICVRSCGDGVCTAGENRCNCPQDCTNSSWPPGCHPNGVPFDPPSELRDRVVFPPDAVEQLCCGSRLVWVRSGPTCDVSSGQVECLDLCGDRICEPDETPCTCPDDCATATDGCAGPGWAYPACFFPTVTCCPGLQALQVFDLITESEHYGECAPSMSCGVICLGECGNGVCDDGEDRCICPGDCS
jgi:hypothetical protein